MPSSVASAAVLLACLSRSEAAAGLRLRLDKPQHLGVSKAPHSKAVRKGCTKKATRKGFQLLAEQSSESLFSADRAVFFDGFSRYGCEQDISPQSQRLYFKDHACGELSSCRLLEVGMSPRICFDFCRAQESARFFGIEAGRDCYCTGYVHAKSTGGGDCDLACEGDSKEKCGGKVKSSVFEMHMCGDSAAEADIATSHGEEVAASCSEMNSTAGTLDSKIHDLVNVWQLGVCSVKPEGERVCGLPKVWLGQAGALDTVLKQNELFSGRLDEDSGKLTEALQAVEDAGEDVTAEQASEVELATEALSAASVKAQGQLAAANLTLKRLEGPFGGPALEAFSEAFIALGDVEGGWNAICALEAIAGQSYVAVANDDPAVCGNHCLGLSTGTDACVAFNYQYKGGLAACQFLKEKGIIEPKSSMNMAVPIFEVSSTKKDEMEIDSLACFASGSFLAGHPRGPLKAHAIREITAEEASK